MTERPTGEVLACFDATCTATFAVCCRLAAGDLGLADALLIDTYLVLVDTAATIGIGGADSQWFMTTAGRIASLHNLPVVDPDLGNGDSEGLREYERWLDDTTRNRCRRAIRTRERPAALMSFEAASAPSRTGVGPHRDPDRAWHPAAAPRPPAMVERSPRRLALGIAAGIVVLVPATLVALDPNDSPSPPSSLRRAVPPRVATPSDGGGEASVPGSAAGYVLGDPPISFRVTGAYETIAQPSTAGWFQLWAQPEATRTSGQWLAIATIDGPLSGRFTIEGGLAIEINGFSATESTSVDGVRQISVQRPGGGRFSVAAFGLDRDQLRSIATDISAQDGRFNYAAADDVLDRGLELLVSAPSPFGNLSSQPRAGRAKTSSYQTLDLSRHLSVSSRRSSPNDLLLAQFLLPASKDRLAPAAPDRSMQLGNVTLIISAETDFGGKTTHTIQWHDGVDTITLSGTADLSVLLAAIPSVQPATIAEWLELSQLPPSYYPV